MLIGNVLFYASNSYCCKNEFFEYFCSIMKYRSVIFKCNHIKVIMLLLSLCILSAAYSQNPNQKFYFFYTDEQIKKNAESNRYISSQVLTIEDSDFSICEGNPFGELVIMNCISVGSVKLIDDVLYCYDERLNRTYRFRQIDFYTLEALNHTAVFLQGTKLYLHLYISQSGSDFYAAFYRSDDLIKSDYWKTGIRNGIYSYQNNNIVKLHYYQNNILTDSITIPLFNYTDSASVAKEILFLDKYGNEINISNYYFNDFELKLCKYTCCAFRQY